MNKTLLILALFINLFNSQAQQASNPVIFSDVPDMSIIRVGNSYYMSSTTMHMSPGVPIMKSDDLVNWKIVNYCYDILDDTDELNLQNGKNTYGRGSWASSIRFHDGRYYVSTFSGTTGKTYIYSTKDIENGTWKKVSFKPSLHDHSLFFDDDGKPYMVYGSGKINIVELNENLDGIIPGTEHTIIENAGEPAGDNLMLPAEGSQLFKVNGKYYLFHITWPRNGMRTVIIHRADKITGPWEGRLALQDKGVAQGGLINTPEGDWYAYLFRDFGAVGRIPYLVPVEWKDNWPILGRNGEVPDLLDLPESKGYIPNIVSSDEFKRKRKDKDLPLVWQWNHNPDNTLWSVRDRKGFLRLTTGRVDSLLTQSRNILTQRTFGPECSGNAAIDVSNMKEGDISGLVLLQKQYGFIGVKYENGEKKLIMASNKTGNQVEYESITLNQETVYLKAECDFLNRKDTATFYYSLDGKEWNKIKEQLKMHYTLPHFMGYRFGLFNYSTIESGGFVDFDYFRISDKISH